MRDPHPVADASDPVLLIHGGLGEDMDAARFWTRPGITDGLRAAGFEVQAPDRDTSPGSWEAAAHAVAGDLTKPVSVVAGSNGVSVAVRLAIQHPGLVRGIVLAWPATAGDARVDARVPEHLHHLLDGETVRGASDDELAGLRMPVTIIPSEPENPFHQWRTVDRLADLIPGAAVLDRGFPESPRPEFPAVRHSFVRALAVLLGDPPQA